jgi:hypothetical protein
MVLVVLLVRENSPDVNSSAIEVDHHYQSILVAANVENDEFADFIDSSESPLELSKVFKVAALANPKPVLEGLFSFWMLAPERPQGPLCDDPHESRSLLLPVDS